jgi:hypothetical protein
VRDYELLGSYHESLRYAFANNTLCLDLDAASSATNQPLKVPHIERKKKKKKRVGKESKDCDANCFSILPSFF